MAPVFCPFTPTTESKIVLLSRSGLRGSRRNIIKQKIKLAYSISVTLADGSNRSLSKSYGYLIIDIADDRCMKFLIMFANIYSIIFKRNHQLIKKISLK
jgi:hypothetical protein